MSKFIQCLGIADSWEGAYDLKKQLGRGRIVKERGLYRVYEEKPPAVSVRQTRVGGYHHGLDDAEIAGL